MNNLLTLIMTVPNSKNTFWFYYHQLQGIIYKI